jgi:hypothetical protein
MKKKIFITAILILSLGILSFHFNFGNEDPGDIAPSVNNHGTKNQADTIPPAGFPYPTMFNFNYSGLGGMNGGVYGAIWFNGKYYFNRWNGTKIYRYYDNGPGGGPGTFYDSLDYIGNCRDLTTDGTFLYGGQVNSTLYRFNPVTMAVVKTFTLTGGVTRGVAWDPNRKGFWNCDVTGNIFFHDTNGVLKQTIPSALTGKTGLGFDSTSSSDSAFLWVWNIANLTNELVKYHIQSGTVKATYIFSSGPSYIGAGGAEVLIKNSKLMLLLNYQNYALAGYKMKDIPLAPIYYNFNNGTSANSFPFNVSSGKAVNSLFLAGEINQPTPIPSGYSFDKVYFRTSNAGTRTYTNLHILLAQSTITTLTSGTFYSGPYDTVFQSASTTLSSTAGGWMEVTLNHPFPYDPAKSLILFVGHCGATGSGGSVYNTGGMSDIRRIWSIGGCPFAAYAGGDASLLNFGVHIIPTALNPPENLYFKFENNPTPASTPNCAAPGVGNTFAPISNVTLGTGGQFDTCLVGTGLSNSGVTTGWNWNTGTSSWTISMWIQIPTSTSGTAYYLFGDAGLNFRCYHNGSAGQNNLILRGTGITDVNVTGIGPAPTVVTFVCQPAFTTPYVIKAYKNGVLSNTVAQSNINLTAGTGFKVGGYSTSSGFIGKMDEFRIYNRALTDEEVLISSTSDIPCGILTNYGNNNFEVPTNYLLNQNYPNPFNPVTKISFSISKAGIVSLKIYDILGREIAKLVNENKPAGNYIVDFDASNLSSGIYFYKLEVNGFKDVKKMTVLK